MLIMWSSCSDKTEYEVVNIDEVLPQAQGNYEYSEDTLQEVGMNLNSAEEMFLSAIPDINFDVSNVLKDRKTLFMPDRLGFSEKDEAYFIKDSVSFHYLKWSFEDSLKTTNAFYNWLDCFGEKCKSIRINDEVNGSTEAFLIWVSNESIYYLGSNKNLSRTYWEGILFPEDDIEFNFKMHQAVRGRILWFVSTSIEEE